MRFDTQVFSLSSIVHRIAISAPIPHRMKQPERGKHRGSLRIWIPGVRYNLISCFNHILIFF